MEEREVPHAGRLQRILVLMLLLFVFLPLKAGAQEKGKPASAPAKQNAVDPEDILNRLWAENARLQTCQANIIITRQNPDFLKDVLPPTTGSNYVSLDGVFNFSRSPRAFNLFLIPRGQESYYYNFTSSDGYLFRLKDNFKYLDAASRLNPVLTRNPFAEVPGRSLVTSVSNPLNYQDGSYTFPPYTPLNLLVPFTFKSGDPAQKASFRRKAEFDGNEVYIISIDSPRYGRSLIYVDTGEKMYVRRVECLDDKNFAYASATYDDFKDFRKGGWMFRRISLESNNRPAVDLVFKDLSTNDPDDIIGAPRPAVAPTPQPTAIATGAAVIEDPSRLT